MDRSEEPRELERQIERVACRRSDRRRAIDGLDRGYEAEAATASRDEAD